ncbi:MAG: hypothetical protein EI684_17160 [Candidatus Viridilinea halotolerans]|uniref:Uncharacterized protein n=1 Tax=Candidatus Viridilinea halotolerans TaxID=2491704 RepID=A0A426TUF0_9CHLR|nr:MAG: hypothetical protein EI684_17160 [Candidatus Viridilinea halotolerans]
MSISRLIGRIIIALTIPLFITACGASSVAVIEEPRPTITPMAAAPTAGPTSTLVPDFISPLSLPEAHEATSLVLEGRYAAAVGILRPLLLNYRHKNNPRYAPDVRTLQEQLASVYLAWGRSTIEGSSGDLRTLSIAYDRLSDGVIIAPLAGPTRSALMQERDLAGMIIAGARSFEQLNTALAASARPTELRSSAEQLVETLSRINEQRADYPGLQPLYNDVLLTTAKLYEDDPGAAQDEQIDALRRALELCRQAAAAANPPAEAVVCAERLSERIILP